jgi:hypothetical protein
MLLVCEGTFDQKMSCFLNVYDKKRERNKREYYELSVFQKREVVEGKAL